METQILFIIAGGVLIFFFLGVKIVRPTHRGLIERLGKYNKFANPGFHWIIPFTDKIYIMLVNEAADKYFTGNAQLLKKLETVEASLKSNAKIVIPAGTELVNIIGEMAGLLPVHVKKIENGRIAGADWKKY